MRRTKTWQFIMGLSVLSGLMTNTRMADKNASRWATFRFEVDGKITLSKCAVELATAHQSSEYSQRNDAPVAFGLVTSSGNGRSISS